MELDADVQAFLAPFNAAEGGLEDQPLAEARANYRALFETSGPVAPAVDRRDLLCPHGDREIPCRLYRPHIYSEGSAPLLVFIHGGGGVLGDIASYDSLMAWMCHRLGYICLSLDYSLAPENPYPAGVDACHHAIQWAVNLADEWGASRDVLVMGDSTGGSIANACSLRARQRGSARIRAQVLLYPVLDLRPNAAYASRARFGDGNFFLSRAGIDWSRANYLAHEQHSENPEVSPLAATDLAGMPATLILTASHDPLRDEGACYAQRLSEAGVPVIHHCAAGAIHGFISFAGAMQCGLNGLNWLIANIPGLLDKQPG